LKSITKKGIKIKHRPNAWVAPMTDTIIRELKTITNAITANTQTVDRQIDAPTYRVYNLNEEE
jgi:hypothetical protein